MNYSIKEMLLDQRFDGYELYQPAGENHQCLAELSKVNIFIGANGSGKGQFLRDLSRMKSLKFIPSTSRAGRKNRRSNIRMEANQRIPA
jgi:AAA15 family ATPase/GTPase